MDRRELGKGIFETSYLQGSFKLRSGLTSSEYFDKYRFESDPVLLRAIAEQMAPLIPQDTEILAGLEMGGIPVATALSLVTGLPTLFVRKQPKNYGTCQFAEGRDFKGKKLLIIEDVVTTGGQVLLSTRDLRAKGAIIDHVLCVIHRGQGNPLEAAQLKLTPLFTMEELKK